MRLKLTLIPSGKTRIGFNYNYYVSSMLYKVLNESSSKYAQELHEKGYMLGKKKFKLFTFSSLFPERLKVVDNTLELSGKIELYISSPVKSFVFHLADGLLSMGKIRIDNTELKVESVEVLPLAEFNREAKFKCLSPVTTSTVEETQKGQRTVPCIPGTEKFIENIKNNLLRKYYLIHKKLPEDMAFEMHFKEDDLKKYSKGKLIKFKEIFIKGFLIPFTVKGSSQLIKTGYDCGFGEKNSAGFGMVGNIKNNKNR